MHDADRGLLEGDVVFLGALAQRQLGPHSFRRSQLLLLALDLAGLAKQVDEHRDLGLDDVGIDRLDQVVDRADRVALIDQATAPRRER